jgi:hypothetical protein
MRTGLPPLNMLTFKRGVGPPTGTDAVVVKWVGSPLALGAAPPRAVAAI